MRQVSRGVVAFALLVGSITGTPARAQNEGSQRVPTVAELSQCPHLAGVNWTRVSREFAEYRATHPDAAAFDVDDEHRRIRGPWPMPDLSRAEIVIDIAIGPGETQQSPTSTSSFAWREPGEAWQVDRVDYAPGYSPPPPPPDAPPMDEAAYARAKRTVTRGPLAPQHAEAIDRVLADPCFAIQPDYTPVQLPLHDGRILPCYGAISRTIRIRRGAETRRVTDLCAHWRPTADLGNAVMYATLTLETVVEQTARAQFPGTEIRIIELREGQRRDINPYYCGEMGIDGRVVPLMFETSYSRGVTRNDLRVPGGPTDRWGSTFEEAWQSRCTTPARPGSGD